MSESNKVDIKEVHDTFRDYAYQQSSKFSEVARTLIWGILGGAWAASLSDGSFSEWNWQLCVAMMSALVYLGIDASHYCTDAIRYRNISKQIADNQSIQDVDKKQKKITEASFYFFIGKLCALILATIFFIVGFIFRYI